LRATLALALLMGCSGGPVLPVAQATTPSLLWTEASHLQILCLVQSADGASVSDVERVLCGRVQQIVSAGSKLPVRSVAFGDRGLIDPKAVTLLVHAAVQPTASGRLVALAVRPHRVTQPSEVLFGARPRAVEVGAPGADLKPLDSALLPALSELLPWQRPVAASR
jgi:hypothetical protein